MKVFISFCIFWSFGVLLKCEKLMNYETNSRKFSKVSLAVDEVIAKVFSKEITTTNLISSESENVFSVKDFKDALLLINIKNTKVVFRQESTADFQQIPAHRKRLLVLIVKSFRGFSQIYAGMSNTNFAYNGLYLIVLTEGEIPEVQEIFKLLWKIQIFNVNVVFEDASEAVLVKTFHPFKIDNCNDSTPTLINEFTDGKFANDVDSFFPDKMRDMNGCSIRVSISNTSRPSVSVDKLPNGTYELKGREINLLNALSASINFTINYTYIGDEGFFFSNGTSEGPLRVLLDGKADLSANGWFLKMHRLKFFDCTASHISEPFVLIIPPGRVLTALEKIIFPFALSVWILILACFAIGFLIIFVIQRQAMKVQSLVFGDGVKNPNLNLVIAFIGDSQMVLPKNSFARFLLMMFLMYSLIVRTLYQGSFYELMNSDKHDERILSIEEMVKKDFTFYVYLGYADIFQGTEAIKSQ